MIRLLEAAAGLCLLVAFWLAVWYLTEAASIGEWFVAVSAVVGCLVVVVWWWDR